MGSAYVDDHRFSLYQGGQWRDITAWVGSPEARDKLEALSVELTFSVLRNQLYDAGMPWPGVRPGSKLRVDNHGREVFSGVVQTVGLDGSVTANDRGWYLTKSKILLQVSNAAAGRRHPADVRQGGDTRWGRSPGSPPGCPRCGRGMHRRPFCRTS